MDTIPALFYTGIALICVSIAIGLQLPRGPVRLLSGKTLSKTRRALRWAEDKKAMQTRDYEMKQVITPLLEMLASELTARSDRGFDYFARDYEIDTDYKEIDLTCETLYSRRTLVDPMTPFGMTISVPVALLDEPEDVQRDYIARRLNEIEVA